MDRYVVVKGPRPLPSTHLLDLLFGIIFASFFRSIFRWIFDGFLVPFLINFSMIFASVFVLFCWSIFDTFRSGVFSFFNVLILWKSLFFQRKSEGFTNSPNSAKSDFSSKFRSNVYPFSHQFFKIRWNCKTFLFL